jgi:hypothetical protein
MSARNSAGAGLVRRRNRDTAAAICLVAGTFVFFHNQEGIQWFMWRDAPLLAVAVTLLALTLAVRAWRAAGG